MKKELRCKRCKKLLAKANKSGKLSLEVKCPKCKIFNEM